ncbi:MAG: hypothetical protein LAO20_08950 [Acidobacteriia bacterium]|nr:hypothetical protein [Terriglobia bacterium]
MSEQNILNPAATSVTNPDYGIKVQDASVFARWQSRSGRPFARRLSSRGQVIQLQWNNRLFSTYDTLRQWARQYENDFFSYFDIDDNRYYSGQFSDMPSYEVAGNQRVNIAANFVVVPGMAQFAYPSNWGVDSIFMEERDGFGQDLVKLTGTWDRSDQNYILWSEQFDNAAWVPGTNVTVTANNATDPLGGNTADTVATGATAAKGVTQTSQRNARNGYQATFSVRVKAGVNTAFTITIDRGVGLDAETSGALTATSSYQTFSFTHSATWTGVTAIRVTIQITNSASSIIPWGAQLEAGAAATAYAQTTAATALLAAPNADANYHGNFAYNNGGTVTTDAAEWKYFGYGLRVWAPKGPDQGIMQVFLDGVSQGTIDLYNAAKQASAALMTVQSVVLGDHRVKLAPTNTKNASSSAFIVTADAIEVMR